MMERRTFLGVVASFLGVGRCAAPTRPMRSKPYMEAGRPEYEEPPPDVESPFIDMDNLTCRWLVDPDGHAHLLGPRPDEEWAALGLEKSITRTKRRTVW